MQKGESLQFTAAVAGDNNPVQTVTWEIEGTHAKDTTITDGMLTIAPDETQATITVKAISTVDKSKYGKAAVTVNTTYTITASTRPFLLQIHFTNSNISYSYVF